MTVDTGVLISLLTALAAIVAPVVTAAINSHTSVKLKHMEIYEQSTHAAVAEFVRAYSFLSDNDSLEAYWDFRSAAYNIVSRIHNYGIQQNILELVDLVNTNNEYVNDCTEETFKGLMMELSRYLSDS